MSLVLSMTDVVGLVCDNATMEAMWLRILLYKLNYPQVSMTVIHVDNQGHTALTHNLVNHSHAKHIDIKHHFICKCVECGEVTLQYISTKEMLEDIFTKKSLVRCLRSSGNDLMLSRCLTEWE